METWLDSFVHQGDFMMFNQVLGKYVHLNIHI